MLVLAEFTDDGAIHRAKILEVKRHRCLVQFLDYGNRGECSKDRIFQYDDKKFDSLGPMAFEVNIEGVDLKDLDILAKVEELAEFELTLQDFDGVVICSAATCKKTGEDLQTLLSNSTSGNDFLNFSKEILYHDASLDEKTTCNQF